MPSLPKGLPARYEFRGELGKGGMGIVYHAWDSDLERNVAIKIVTDGLIEIEQEPNDPFIEYLKKEAQIACALHHPGVVPVYYAEFRANPPYVVMEYVDGHALKALLTEGEPYDREKTKDYLKQAASALDYLHQNDVVHRDITLSNILISQKGEVKICDFGLAKLLTQMRTSSTVPMGTPEFVAPERLRSGVTGFSVDQWALGVVAYRMLTGQLPFHWSRQSPIEDQILEGRIPPMQNLDPAISAAVKKIFGKVLAQRPQDRYASCTKFVAALVEALEPTQVAKPPLTSLDYILLLIPFLLTSTAFWLTVSHANVDHLIHTTIGNVIRLLPLR